MGATYKGFTKGQLERKLFEMKRNGKIKKFVSDYEIFLNKFANEQIKEKVYAIPTENDFIDIIIYSTIRGNQTQYGNDTVKMNFLWKIFNGDKVDIFVKKIDKDRKRTKNLFERLDDSIQKYSKYASLLRPWNTTLLDWTYIGTLKKSEFYDTMRYINSLNTKGININSL